LASGGFCGTEAPPGRCWSSCAVWRAASAGIGLDLLRDDLAEILAEWMPSISLASLFGFAAELGALPHLLNLTELVKPLDPDTGVLEWEDRYRLVCWLLGVEGALDGDNFYDPPKGGVDEKALNLARLAVVDPEAAQPALVKFVRQDWYRGHKGQSWWGMHQYNNDKTPFEGFGGYWCWEAAAIARICGVDDSALEGHKYYPYDLAHYLD